MSGEFPAVTELLPQAGAMRLLDCVLAHDAQGTRCAVAPSDSALFRDGDGRIPVWIGLEYLAQCAAVDGSLRLRARGERPGPAILVGSRRLDFRADAFDPARRLEVTARHAAGRAGGLLAFDCAVLDPDGGDPLVAGRLNVLPLAGRLREVIP